MNHAKICTHCSGEFKVYKSGLKRKFCSMTCSNAHQTKSERRELFCKECGNKFVARTDHGKFPLFCSRECFAAKALTPEPKECANCGGVFMANKTRTGNTEDGLRKYCSNKCRHEGMRNSITKICLNCSAEFFMQPSLQAIRGEESCCSQECRVEYYKGARSSEWEGGNHFSQSIGGTQTYMERPGYVGKYIQDHRLAASRYLGRPVERGEVVIHVNKVKSDNRIENLFICGSMSQYAKIRSGSIAWPKAGNIVGG